MKTKDVSKLIGTGESTTIEWKPSLAQINEMIEGIAAFSNTEGGRLFVGISKNGAVTGVSIGEGTVENLTNRIAQHTEPKTHPRISVLKIGDKEIIVVEVKESHDKPVLADGRPYLRVGKSTRQMAKEEYERLILEKHKADLIYDSQVCKGAGVGDISKEKLIAFVKKAREERGLGIKPNASVPDILNKLKLTIKDKKITNAAVLLFGKDPQQFFVQAELKAIRFRGYDETGEMTDFKTIGADAITLLEKAESFIFDHIPMKAWIESGKLQRQEKWLYPPKAIREALANALAHRDYKSTGKLQVRIFDDRMEIWNPGKLPPGLTVEKLKRTHDSIPPNPLIARAFFWIRYAEEVGTGTNKIIQWCKQWSLPEPKFEEAGGSFVVTFRVSKLSEDILASLGLNERQTKAIGYVKGKGKITNREYQNLTNISKQMATLDLKFLVDKEVFTKIGKTGRGTMYILNNG